jgi:hypothetical protein
MFFTAMNVLSKHEISSLIPVSFFYVDPLSMPDASSRRISQDFHLADKFPEVLSQSVSQSVGQCSRLRATATNNNHK